MKATVSEKGQVTIPKSLRESLGITPGTQLEFEEQEGRLVAVRVVDADPFEKLVGLLPRMDVDSTLAELRGAAWNAANDRRSGGHRRR